MRYTTVNHDDLLNQIFSGRRKQLPTPSPDSIKIAAFDAATNAFYRRKRIDQFDANTFRTPSQLSSLKA